MDVQAGLHLSCSQTPEDRFSCVQAHAILLTFIKLPLKSLRSLFCFFLLAAKDRFYCILFRLCDIYQTVEKAKPGVKFTDNAPPILGRGGKKGDIYQLVGF